jgi:hypothetical protein
MNKSLARSIFAVSLFITPFLLAQEEIIFHQDFESDAVGETPSGHWYINQGTGASCLVSDEATDVPGSPSGSRNLKFAKSQTGTGTDLTVQWSFEEHAEKVMTSGKLTASYWVYFDSGALMRHIAFRGYSPYKQYMKMVVRGDWPGDVRLEFPINGPQVQLTDAAWHKLTFAMSWDPVWPLPAEGIPKSEVTCRFFVDGEEHPGSPANILENLVSPFGSVELNTRSDLAAVCYLDDITVSVSLPPPAVESLAWDQGKVALRWADPLRQLETAFLYRAPDATGPWTLLQGNIESSCLINPGETSRSFYRVGSQQPASPDRKDIFADDFEAYTTSAEVETVGGWTIINGSGVQDVTWRLWNTAGEPLNAEDPDLVGMSGNYVISDSDFAQDARLDEELISPPIDCSAYGDVWVEFNCNINVYEDDPEDLQVTDLDVSVYDPASRTWSEWISVFSRDMKSGDWSSETPRILSLSQFADGREVKIRWRFHESEYDFWWAIDDVRVTGE